MYCFIFVSWYIGLVVFQVMSARIATGARAKKPAYMLGYLDAHM